MDDQALILYMFKKYMGFSGVWKESLTFFCRIDTGPSTKDYSRSTSARKNGVKLLYSPTTIYAQILT
jgi:hypothetical protein